MSYARFGWDGSDVYVFFTPAGFLECCGCLLQEREWVEDEKSFFGGYLKAVGVIVSDRFYSTQAMLEHLRRHQAEGYNVPPDIFADLLADDERNFPKAEKAGES